MVIVVDRFTKYIHILARLLGRERLAGSVEYCNSTGVALQLASRCAGALPLGRDDLCRGGPVALVAPVTIAGEKKTG